MIRKSFRTVAMGVVELFLATALAVSGSVNPSLPAAATPTQPAVVDSQSGPTGIAIGSSWLVDSGGSNAWSYGISSTGYGTLVTYKPGTGTWSTSTLLSGETGVVGAAYSASANLAAFSATRPSLGNRIVWVNLATGAKTFSHQMTTVQTNVRALAFDSTGANLWVATNDNPSLLIKLASATGNESAYMTMYSGYKDPTSMVPYGAQMIVSFATSPVRLGSFSTTSVSMTSSAALPAGTPTLVDPVVSGGFAYYGSDSTPGRITAVDLSTLAIVGSLDLAAGETGARGLSIDSASDTLYATTSTASGTRLVVMSASSLTRRGDTNLGAGSAALATFRTGQRLTVGFAGTRGVTTLSVAGVPATPTNLAIEERDSALAVSWSAPASAEPITGYTATATGGGSTTTCTTTSLSCVFTGLTNGVDYVVAVSASSIAGTSTTTTGSGNPRTIPSSPSAVTATRGDRALAVSWTPGNDGGRPVIDFVATASPGGLACTSTSATHCTISGLTNGTAYTVRVVARTSVGTSNPSGASAAVTPATIPDAPPAITGTRGNASITVTWSEPPSNGGAALTGYTVSTEPASAGCDTDARSCTITGLRNGTSYLVFVRARNDVGISVTTTSLNAITPATTPTAVRTVSTLRGDRTVHIDWLAPTDDGGDAITSYRVIDSHTGDVVCATVDTRCTVGSLINGETYSFDVVAVNSVGISPAERGPAAIPASRPAPMSAPVAVRGDRSVSLLWTAPPGNAGVPVIRYVVSDSTGIERCVTVEFTCTVTGLTNGHHYEFVVIAVNEVGSGDPSGQSDSVVPATIPSVVSNVSATRGDREVLVNWANPTDDGGDAVTEFRVTSTATGDLVCVTTQSSCLVTALTNGRDYSFDVVAVNSVGSSLAVRTATVIPATHPSRVLAPIVERGDRRVSVGWNPPDDDGGLSVLRYRVVDDRGTELCVTEVATCTVTGLTNGRVYRFAVIAENEVGASVPSDLSVAVTPATTASPIVDLRTTRGNRSILLEWSAPTDDGGDTVIGYRVTDAATGTLVCSTPGTSCDVSPLTNGNSYEFDVVAVNSVGASSARRTDPVIPASRPSVVAAPFTSRRDRAVALTWAEPLGDSGVPVLQYTVIDDGGQVVCSVTEAHCDVTELVNGRGYRFAVRAENEVGDADYSALSDDVIPATVPEPPRMTEATSENGGAFVSWELNTDDGGDPTTGVVVRVWWEGSLIREIVTDSHTLYLDGLTNGESYRVTISAVNGVGESALSAPALLAPLAPPVVEPPIVEPPIVDPPVPDPTPTSTTDPEPTIPTPTPTPTPSPSRTPVPDPSPTTSSPRPPVTSPPLPKPTPTRSTVPEPPVVRPPVIVTAPEQPFGVALLTLQRRTMVVGWGAPANGGSLILDYRIESSARSTGGFKRLADSVSPTTVASVKRLGAGKWYIRVIAINAVGLSAPSTPVKIVLR